MRNGSLSTFLVFAISCASQPAFALTATTTFNVTIEIESECVINSAGNLDFSSSGVLSADIPAESTIQVHCTEATDYDIGLSVGAGETPEAREMTGGSGSVIYGLYQDDAHLIPWGDTIGTDTQSGTGDGSAQDYQVYGLVPGTQATPPPGSYSDVITVTVTYN